VPALPLVDEGWVYTEPNPYNPPGNLRPGDARPVRVDLCRGDPGGEAIDINHPAGSPGFFAGNRRFLTKRLWGAASEPPYFHHGRFTTLREATLAHDGEARTSRQAFEGLNERERDAVIEFLKSLQVEVPEERGGRARVRRH